MYMWYLIVLWENKLEKKCPRCGSKEVIRKGTRNGASYWLCHSCRRYFSGRSRMNLSAVYRYYAEGTYTIAQIAERLGISCSTVKRKMKDLPLRSTSITPRTVALQMDTTYSRSKLWRSTFHGCRHPSHSPFQLHLSKGTYWGLPLGDSLPQRTGDPSERGYFWWTIWTEKSLSTNPLPILSVPSSAAHQTAAHQSSKTSCFYRFEGD